MAARRAIIEFTPDGDPWPVILDWAQSSRYRPIQRGDGSAHFQKGLAFSALRRGMARKDVNRLLETLGQQQLS